MEEKLEREHFEKNYKDVNLSAKVFRKRIGCDLCKNETSTEAFLGWNGSVLWICGNCYDKIISTKNRFVISEDSD